MARHSHAYAAGIVDGEGCLQLQGGYTVAVRVKMGSRAVIQFLQDLYGGSTAERDDRRSDRLMHEWLAFGDTARAALQAMMPYLIEKAPQAMLLLEVEPSRMGVRLSDTERAKRAYIVRRLRELKAASA